MEIVPNADIAGVIEFKRKVHGDNRGWFVELFRRTVYQPHGQAIAPQVALSKSAKHVLRGVHCSPYPKLVTCPVGKLFDVVVDMRPASPTFGKWRSCELSSESLNGLFIPAGVGHGFVALEESQILYVQGGEFTPGLERDLNPFDPELAIDWPVPKEQLTFSAKDGAAPLFRSEVVQKSLAFNIKRTPRKCHVLLMGASGYFGSEIEKHLLAAEVDYVVCGVRLEQRESIAWWLEQCTPQHVICAAGTAGKPNITWCETNQAETMDMNLTTQIALAEECRKRSVHCTLISTGMLYDPSMKPAGHVFTEEDEPNIHLGAKPAPMYCQLRVIEEQLLKLGGFLDAESGNVLAIRIIFPLTDNMHERSVLSKLKNYSKVFSMAATWSVLDELLPVTVQLALKQQKGLFNMANPGQMTHNELMLMYKKHIDPTASWECATAEEMVNARMSAPLSMEKLFTVMPEAREQIQPIAQATDAMLARAATSTKRKREEM